MSRGRSHLSTRGLPLGWAAQIRMPGSGSTAKGNAKSTFWSGHCRCECLRPGQQQRKAVAGDGAISHQGEHRAKHDEVMNGSLKPPGSRFFPIGGTFYRTHVRRKANIRARGQSDERKDMVEALGAGRSGDANQVGPVDVVFPDGKTRRSVETRTRNTGQFTAGLRLLMIMASCNLVSYRIQASYLQRPNSRTRS